MDNIKNFAKLTVEQFAKMREWVMNGGSFFVDADECNDVMTALRTSKCPCEYSHYSEGLCVIFPHVGL